MIVIRIQHTVPSFEKWKHAFDADPMDRKASGVRSYRVFRSVEDPNVVMVDLEFDSRAAADAMFDRLGQLWAGPGAAVMMSAAAMIVEAVESVTIAPTDASSSK